MGQTVNLELGGDIGGEQLEALLEGLPDFRGRSGDWFEYFIQLERGERYFIAMIAPRPYGLEFYAYWSDPAPERLLERLKERLAALNVTVREV